MQSETEGIREIIPDSINSPIDSAFPNKEIIVYQGEYDVDQRGSSMHVDGVIKFVWFPQIKIIFQGQATIVADGSFDHFNEIDIRINNLLFGKGHLYSRKFSIDHTGCYLEGHCFQGASGDSSIGVSQVNFSVLNLQEYAGQEIKTTTPDFVINYLGRIVFEDGDYVILLDKLHNYKSLYNTVKADGGFQILYAGQIRKKKGNILLNDLKEFRLCFAHMLYFLNGQRTSPLFLSGMHEGEEIWRDYSVHKVDTFKKTTSWSQYQSPNHFNQIWITFSTLWKDANDKDFLVTVIHWYLEANSGNSYIEGRIIFAQTALELIYNWLLVEKRKLIIGKDADSIAASNKIRLLLSQLNTPTSIPLSFVEILAMDDIIDAPDIFVKIRNALVHGQEKKRKDLADISDQAKYDMLRLGVWYIELSLLHILNYKGNYFNRVSNHVEKVPWG